MFDEPIAAETRPSDQDIALRLMLVGLWKRRRLLCAAVLLSAALALVASRTLATSRYAGMASVMFDRAEFRQGWDRELPPLGMMSSLVTSEAVVNAAALASHVSRADLAAAVGVQPDRDGGGMIMGAEWRDAAIAEATAVALRNAFVEALRATLDESRKQAARDLEKRARAADSAVEEANRRVREFLTSNGVTLSDMAMGASPTSLAQMQLSVTEAQAERAMIAQELQEVRRGIPGLSARVGEEMRAARESARAAQDTNRSNATLGDIEALRARGEAQADVQYYGVALRRARLLTDQGYMSRQELDLAQQAYDRSRAQLVADSEFRNARQTLAELAGRPAVLAMAPSEAALSQQVLQAHNLSRQLAVADGKVERLGRQYAEARAKALAMPKLQEKYDVLATRLQRLQSARNETEVHLARLRAAPVDPSGVFPGVLASQPVETKLVKSRALLVGGLVFVVSMLLTVAGLLLRDLRDRRVKAPVELSRGLGVPVVGAVPQLSEKALAGSDPLVSAADFDDMVRHLRQLVPQRGARVMLVSLRHGEGKSLVTQGLARAAAVAREDVVVLDAEVHSDTQAPCDGTWLLPPADVAVHDIRDYLAGHVQRVEEVLHPTTVANVTCLPLLDRRGAGEMLASPRLGSLMDHVSRHHGLVLVEGAPLEETAAQQMWSHVDAVILVVQSRTHTVQSLKDQLRPFAASEARVVGAVMTHVEGGFMVFDSGTGASNGGAEGAVPQGVVATVS